jgi:hypothetical protein
MLALLAALPQDDGLDPFARECLQIKTKTGKIEQLELNKVQLVCHEKLEQQREEKGWVRALILKGRQPGISTYVGARYYRKTSLWKGINTFILSHEQGSSDKLFEMVDRFQRNNPLAPHLGASNAKEMIFDKLDSSYTVATAGSKGAGRGSTIRLFHGSEAAYWANAPAHFAASVQAIPLLPGTEIILESTSNGAGGEFYERCLDAEAGRGDYQLIFLPWFLSDAVEYQRPPEPGFELSKRQKTGKCRNRNMPTFTKSASRKCAGAGPKSRSCAAGKPSAASIRRPRPKPGLRRPAWSRSSIQRGRGARSQAPGDRAVGPLILGVDPASNGGDRFSVAHRRGQVVQKVEYRNKIDTWRARHGLRELIDTLRPARVNIDAGNIGAAIITNLKSLGPPYTELVRGVNFGGTSQAKLAQPKVPGPRNRRAEMWARTRDYLNGDEPVKLPDMDALQTDLTRPSWCRS